MKAKKKSKVIIFIPGDLRKVYLDSKNQEVSVYALIRGKGLIKDYTEFYQESD